MKSRVSKLIAVIALIAIMVSTMAISVSAEVYSDEFFVTRACTAGSYTSEATDSLTTSLGSVYGGDMGIWFYVQNVGLQASFTQTTSRIAYMECYESDGSDNNDCLARKYQATFEKVYGLYRPYRYSITYTSPYLMEGHGVIEPFMRFKISTATGDTSKSVPAGILMYQFWVYE